ncbi:MAG: SH3 domain-containing protein [Halofilum sp. (in: g-proteobacteria)]|nr:SH3 domain-containing protein [Halofilum sp. (in: g-proteobacteria)]
MSTRTAALVMALVLATGCATQPPRGNGEAAAAEAAPATVPAARLEAAREEQRRLRTELTRARQRADDLGRENERLRADLADAEDALVTLESGLKGRHSRADAVSALADARILVERAARAAPWGGARVARARAKLGEAERHIEAGNFGSAVFFTARGRRIAEEVLAELEALRADPDTRYVQPRRANVRDAPSMDAPVALVLERGTPVRVRAREGSWMRIVTPAAAGNGWIYGELLTEQP